jgi:hypothetical protein
MYLVGPERVELSSTGYEPDASTDMLRTLVFILASLLTIVNEYNLSAKLFAIL